MPIMPHVQRDHIPKTRQGQFTIISGQDASLLGNQQAELHLQVARATISANLPEHWIEDPEVKKMFALLRSQVPLPTCRSIGGSLLSGLQQDIDEKNMVQYSGQEVTLAVDGWENIKKDALVGFVINDDGKVLTLEVNNMTRKQKTGQVLFELIDDQLQILLKKDRGGIRVVAVYTDDGSDCRLVRRLLKQKYSWLITTVCFAYLVCKIFIFKTFIACILY